MNSDMRKLAILLMIASSVVISFSGLIVRLLEAGPLVMNFYRGLFLMCAVIVLLVVRYRGATVIRVIGVGWPGLIAGIMLAGAAMTFLQSLTHTTVANTLFLLGAIPFVTAALAWVFLKERPNSATLVTMAIAFAGIVIMIGEGFAIGSSYGNLMALLTTLLFFDLCGTGASQSPDRYAACHPHLDSHHHDSGCTNASGPSRYFSPGSVALPALGWSDVWLYQRLLHCRFEAYYCS